MATAMANGETYKYSDEDMQMGGSVQSTQDGAGSSPLSVDITTNPVI